jgi:soluble lytic murein transglycosylase-like protein
VNPVGSISPIGGVQARIREIVSEFDMGMPFAQVLSSVQAQPTAAISAPSAPSRAASVAPVTPATPGQAGGWARKLPEAAQQWLPHIERIARRNGVDPKLLAALVKQESGFQADVRSPAGAIGLAQLMPGTARELGVDPTDPIANLEGGARYLRSQLDRFGSAPLALAAYNAGPGRVAASGGIPDISETQNYVRNVMAFYRELGGTP